MLYCRSIAVVLILLAKPILYSYAEDLFLEAGFEEGIDCCGPQSEYLFGGQEFASNSEDVLESSAEQAVAGSRSLKVVVNKDGPLVANSRRAEVTRFPKPQTLDDVVWLGFSIYIPEDYRNFSGITVPNYSVVMQWHGNPDRDCGEPYRRPPMSLVIHDSFTWRVWLLAQRSSCELDRNQYDRKMLFSTGDWTAIKTNAWTHWVMAWKRTHRTVDNGWFKMWKAEDEGPYTQVIDDVGINYFNDDAAGYLKLGLYKSPFEDNPGSFPTTAREYAYYDEVKLALTSDQDKDLFDMVSPTSGEPTPLTAPNVSLAPAYSQDSAGVALSWKAESRHVYQIETYSSEVGWLVDERPVAEEADRRSVVLSAAEMANQAKVVRISASKAP